ncbi:MAG: hypothetical protein BroJett026_08220 [Betaproteobacteria bacterium]|nr:MAG: hypothetical protein BroJett026_08220 [Betaproteobacteria bacterium]
MLRLLRVLLAASIAAPFPIVAPTAGAAADVATVTVIEYHHAGLDHYFITASEAEQQALDSGATRGWRRTGFAFTAYPPATPSAGASPVCRFYGRPDAGLDSHFYSASPEECGSVAQRFGAHWLYESSNVFRIALPDTRSGACAAGSVAVYRLFNNRHDANHRYTADAGVRDQMIAAGYVPEGYGPESVAFCAVSAAAAPPPTGTPAAGGGLAPAVAIAYVQNDLATFAFTGTATPASGATIVSRTWDHGDGTSASGAASTHTYAASGTYTVRFTVGDSKGGVSTASATVAATAGSPPVTPSAPTVTIAVVTIAPDTFDFGSTASAADGAAIASYAWSFGDGGIASGPTARWTYNADGNYLVTLKVTDSRGRSATATRTVTATKPGQPPAAVPAPAPGTWVRYDTSNAAGTEVDNHSWYNLTWDTRRNVAYGHSWNGELTQFDPATGRWTRLTPRIGGGVHNRVLAYDPVNDRVWLGSGTGSQLVGVNYYDPATQQWVNHPMSGRTPGSEAAMIFDPAGKRFVVFGGWQRIALSTFSVDPVANTMTTVPVSGGPSWGTEASRMTAWRSTLDTRRNRILYVDVDGAVWALPLTLTGWQKLTPSGTPPPDLTQYVYDASVDALVGWASSPRLAGGDTTPGSYRETWLLPLGSMTWMKAASAASNDFVPTDNTYVGYSLVYDPVRRQVILHTQNGNYNASTWAYKAPANLGSAPPPPATTPPPPATTPPPPATTPPPAPPPTPGTTAPAPVVTSLGTITSFPLPADRNVPHSSVNGSKHTNLAYSPATGRLYVQGGDWLHSATDGTWSMSLVDGSWRQDVGAPVYPSRPAPHALQDGAGFEWVPGRNRFLIWPGLYYPYEAAGAPIREYSKGAWWFDPATNAYTQELGLFGNYGESSGSLHGGIYDAVRDEIVVLLDSGKGLAVRRWHVGTLARLADIPLRIQPPVSDPNYRAHYFTRGKYATIGRHVYVVGYSTDGNNQTPRFWRWHLDNLIFEDLAPPPVGSRKIEVKESRLGASNGKIVWPFHTGPEGELHGIYVYDPATDTWSVDTTVPPYGNFIGNAVTSLPDGRVAFSGGAFGRQQTHMWFYKAH